MNNSINHISLKNRRDLPDSFHPWELDLKNALHPWELGCLKRVGFRHWKVIRVIVVAIERVDDGEKP